MSELNLTEVREYLVELLLQAGAILNSYFRSAELKLRSKTQVDIVTEADEAVDKFIQESIGRDFPGYPVLTEEKTAPAPYSELEKLDNLWVADPLDGTFNFSRGRTNFAVSGGLVRRGKVVVSVVYIPQEEETFWAQQDRKGAYRQDTKRKITQIYVSQVKNLKQASIAFDWVADYPELSDSLKTFSYFSKMVKLPRRQFLSMGSAVADLTHLATGQLEVYINCGLNPWDVIPYLLVEKAGGQVTTPTGEAFNVFQRNILATNNKLHRLILNSLKKKSNFTKI